MLLRETIPPNVVCVCRVCVCVWWGRAHFDHAGRRAAGNLGEYQRVHPLLDGVHPAERPHPLPPDPLRT